MGSRAPSAAFPMLAAISVANAISARDVPYPAAPGLIAAFANGIVSDRDAVQAAISSAWSTGQTEGQICKLRVVKPQIYGPGKIDLLLARAIGMN